MDEKYLRDRLHHAAETRLSGLAPDPWLTQRVLSSTKGEEKVKKKLSIGFVLVLALVLAAMTALAVGLSSYFGGFAKLEDTYGEFEQWPNSAKVELTQLMINNGVLSEEEATKWTGGLSGPEKELLADEILAAHFADMTYVDTYNAMTRELGPIEKWTDEERVLYTSLLEDYGKLTSSWPTYMLPGDSDLTREEAVARGREAVLTMFSVSAKELDSLVVDAIFSKDSVTLENTPEDEPFWIIEFGYGMAYRAIMTRNGEMLGLMGPQTQYIPWGVSTMGNAQVATPSDHDATREQAIQSSKSSLTEIVNLSYEEVEAMDATAHFFYNDLYCYGDEPVWLVIWSKQGKDQWQVLLGYDASYLDAEPSGKVFDQVVRRHTTLADIWRERCGEIGMTEDFRDANGAYCFD